MIPFSFLAAALACDHVQVNPRLLDRLEHSLARRRVDPDRFTKNGDRRLEMERERKEKDKDDDKEEEKELKKECKKQEGMKWDKKSKSCECEKGLVPSTYSSEGAITACSDSTPPPATTVTTTTTVEDTDGPGPPVTPAPPATPDPRLGSGLAASLS